MTKPSILIVDDSASVRSIIQVYLMSLKVELVEADTGERALQLLKLLPISLVIADVQLPGIDGITMVQRLRAGEVPAAKQTPVLLLTGSGEDCLTRGLEAGANDFLRKPISPAALTAAVSRFISGG